MNRRHMLAAGGALMIGGGALMATQPWRGRSDGLPALGAANAQTAAEVDTSSIVEMTLGDEAAPVTLVEYASYTCPHCRTFHENAFKSLKSEYIDTGKVKFIFREVYFDRYGLWASMVARCGDGSRFFGVTDLIFEGQREWLASNDPATIADELRRIGRTAGMSSDEVDGCLQDAEMAQTLVAWYQQNAEADEVRSTPSFVIDGEKYSNMGLGEFRTLLDGKLDS